MYSGVLAYSLFERTMEFDSLLLTLGKVRQVIPRYSALEWRVELCQCLRKRQVVYDKSGVRRVHMCASASSWFAPNIV
jgi:hypothetical protein